MRGGDEAAFDEFYARCSAQAFALALRLSGDRESAGTLTQDAFVRAWERIGTFRGESRLSTWLHRIIVRLALDRSRERSRWTRWFDRGSRDVPDDLVDTVDLTSEDTGLRLDLERAISSLPRGARQMLVLRDVEGYSYEEISQLTGTTMGTVKAQIHRARKLVKEMLER